MQAQSQKSKCANDILLFAWSALEVGRLFFFVFFFVFFLLAPFWLRLRLLDSLVAELSGVGLLLNADAMVVLTSQSQPPSTIKAQQENHIEGPAKQRRTEMVGLHGTCTWIGTKKTWICNTISSKRQRRIMPTNRFWRTGGFLFLSVSAILILLFHRLLAFQVGIVPFTKNTYKPWIFIFENLADPMWALRRTLTGHSHGIKFCTFGTNELHILFASRRLRAGRECVLVLGTGISCCSTPHSPLDTTSFALATRAAKATPASKTMLGDQIGDVLSLRGVGSLGSGSTKLWALEKTFQYVCRFLLPMSMLRMQSVASAP